MSPQVWPKRVPRILTGSATTTSAAGVPTAGFRSGTVTFPSGFFTATPTVMATPNGTGSWTPQVQTRNVSTSGFTFDIPYEATQTGISWLAVQT